MKWWNLHQRQNSPRFQRERSQNQLGCILQWPPRSCFTIVDSAALWPCNRMPWRTTELKWLRTDAKSTFWIWSYIVCIPNSRSTCWILIQSAEEGCRNTYAEKRIFNHYKDPGSFLIFELPLISPQIHKILTCDERVLDYIVFRLHDLGFEKIEKLG